ncbi:replicative DNA helicase [Kribbella sp. NPDC023972]|uniref:replicative DNA helicase n=1 Tax=Kribbella sp. NPDC023972 TaxID=3154795 RepID=UPI0033F1B839
MSAQPIGPDYGYDHLPATKAPPQDLAAEQCVLGALMLSKDAIADVIETLRGTDFYRPAHEIVFDAITDLYARGEPADAITVAAELTKRGEMSRIGGAPYVHTLVASVPLAANASYYAHIVREKAILRRLVEAGTKIVQLGYAGEGEVDDVVDEAQAEIYQVTEKRTTEDYAPVGSLLESTMDEIEAIAGRGGQMIGIPTGFADLDELTNGLHPGQMIIVAGRPAMGKALALDTPLPTPTGWTTMGEVAVGDQLLGADGHPTQVVAATEVLHDRPCYSVEFSDGSSIVADAEHQWITTTRASRRAASERRPSRLHFPLCDVERVTTLAASAAQGPDQLVSASELIDEAGLRFRHVLRSVILRQVPMVTRLPRQFERASGTKYTWATPVYSRHLLLKALAEHVSRPVGSWNPHSHSRVVTTAQIAASLRHESATESRLNHAINTCAALQLPDRELPLPPYTFGAWLGDGHSAGARLTSADSEVVARIKSDGVIVTKTAGDLLFSLRLPVPDQLPERTCAVCGRAFVPSTHASVLCSRRCSGRGTMPVPVCSECGSPAYSQRVPLCRRCSDAQTFKGRLRSLGVLNNKHIPVLYLRASEQQRRKLLAGLLDTDGHASSDRVEFANTNERLARDVFELVCSLGYKPTMRIKQVRGRTTASSTCYTIGFATSDQVFHLARKAGRAHPCGPKARQRMVVAVRPIPSVPVRCVEVDNADHLYLAGKTMIPTHNSTLGLDFARSASIKHGLTSCIFSLEMSRNEITMRLLSAEAKVPLHHMRSGRMTDEDWARLARKVGDVSEAPLFIDDSPNLTMMEIRAKARRLKQRHDLRLIVIDYLQLMTSGKKVESRQLEVSEFSRSIKLLAKELEIPVVAICQLNRGSEQRADKRPMASDLRESGSLEQDSDVVILVHREDAYERESTRPGEADLIVAKHRNGPTADVVVAFQGHYSRFVDMAQSA